MKRKEETEMTFVSIGMRPACCRSRGFTETAVACFYAAKRAKMLSPVFGFGGFWRRLAAALRAAGGTAR